MYIWEQMEKDGGFEETEEHIELLEECYPAYVGEDRNSEEQYEMVFEDKIQEAVKILCMYDRNCKISMGYAMSNTRKFLKENFNLEDK